jgi:hypothetical protein
MAKFGSLRRMRGDMLTRPQAQVVPEGDRAIWTATECGLTAQLSHDAGMAIRRLDGLANLRTWW